jgi:hypothetical protein
LLHNAQALSLFQIDYTFARVVTTLTTKLSPSPWRKVIFRPPLSIHFKKLITKLTLSTPGLKLACRHFPDCAVPTFDELFTTPLRLFSEGKLMHTERPNNFETPLQALQDLNQFFQRLLHRIIRYFTAFYYNPVNCSRSKLKVQDWP